MFAENALIFVVPKIERAWAPFTPPPYDLPDYALRGSGTNVNCHPISGICGCVQNVDLPTYFTLVLTVK